MIFTSVAIENNQRNFWIKKFILSTLFFFLPAAASYPGRAYYYLTNLQNYAELPFNDVSLFNLILLPTIFIGIFMLIYRIIFFERIINYCSYFSFLTFITIAIFTLAGTISAVSNYDTPGVITNYFSGVVSTAVLTLAFNNLRLSPKLFIFIFMAFLLGSLFPLLFGLYTFYQAWGIPNLSEIIFSHFDLIKMYEYGIQTFGNADNTAVFMGMAGVIFFGCLLNKNTETWSAWFYGLGLILVIIHLFILEIRSSFFCFFIITLSMSFIYNRKIFYLYLITTLVIFLLLYLVAPDFFGLYIKRMLLAITWSRDASSQSVAERLHAMHIGWKIFLQNYYLGVGSGGAMNYISYASAHQFNIQQGVELGFLGFFSSICLCLLGIGRFIQLGVRYFIYRKEYERIIFAATPAFYFLYSIIANVPLNDGIVNTWISLSIVMLLLSDFVTIHR